MAEIPHESVTITTFKCYRTKLHQFATDRQQHELALSKTAAGAIQLHGYRFVFRFNQKNLRRILQTGIANNVFTEKEISGWWLLLEQDAKANRFFASYACFIVREQNDKFMIINR